MSTKFYFQNMQFTKNEEVIIPWPYLKKEFLSIKVRSVSYLP
jgi:hypothetical protein